MSRIRTIVLLVVASFLWAFVINERVLVEQQKPQSRESFFEMSLEELMEVEVASVSEEKEELSKAVGAIYLADSTVRNI